MLNDILRAIDEQTENMIQIRRYLHRHPELSFHEYKTAKFIQKHYDKLDIPYEKDLGGNGVIATLEGGLPGKTVALRADFDALPIQDEKDVSYKSQNEGISHACGHDGHTASLLALASVLNAFKPSLKGKIVFLHQHAEEIVPGGAKSILETGALDQIDAIFGTHLWSTIPLGEIHTNKESFMAGADKFTIKIKGDGGHGAYPHETNDSIVAAAHLITQIQTIISRRIDPVKTGVITIGEMRAGSSFNVIADTAELTGTVRYLETEIQQEIIKELKRLTNGLSEAHQVEMSLDYERGYPPVKNHPAEVDLVLKASRAIADVTAAREVAPHMSAEDFAYYLQEKPGAYFFTGARLTDEERVYPHHHPKFDFNEQAMPLAAKVLASAYYHYVK